MTLAQDAPPIRYGLSGGGYFGLALAAVLHTLPGAQVVAAHSGTGAGAGRVAAALGCAMSPTLDALLRRDDLDALIVATPNHLHREPVIAAAQQGKHVFCEKPFALSLADCDAMLDACRAAGVTLMVGHILRFHSGMLHVKRWIDGGLIGRPLVAHVERTGWEPPRETVSWKKMQAQSGGHLFHHIHEIDLLLWLVGPVAEVYAVGGNLAHSGPGYGDEDDVLLLTLAFAGGAFGSMQYGSGFRWGEHYIKINGTEGAVLINHKDAAISLLRAGHAAERYPMFDDAASQESLLALFARTDGGSVYGGPQDETPLYLRRLIEAELGCFHAVLRGEPIPPERRMLFDGTAARASIELASAALRAKASGQPVRLPLPEEG